jgi:hypothetical protein
MLVREAVGTDSTAAERELMLRAVATRRVRQANEERMRALLPNVDRDSLLTRLDRHRLLEVVGSRLVDLGIEDMHPGFEARVHESLARTRRVVAQQQLLTVKLVRQLAINGVDSMAIKGVFMAESLYQDPSFRLSSDIDLLVERPALDEAVEALLPLGYTVAGDARTPDGLPELHQTLEPVGGPNVEVHWRVHWNERGLAHDLLARATPDHWRGRIPTPADELAILLISLSKDAFIGLRYVADIAAWWDTYGEHCSEPPVADMVLAHPELRSSVLASARVVERLAGVPALALHGQKARPALRTRLAVRLADPTAQRSLAQATSEVSLVDLLLSPWRRVPSVLRRHREISHTHGLRARTSSRNGRLATLRYDTGGILRLIPRFVATCGRVFRGPASRPLGDRSVGSRP